MKKVITEVDDGLEALLGDKVLVMCVNYFYTGILEGVNTTCIKLKDPSIVYETGEWSDSNYKNVQKLPTDIYVQTAAIEAFGALKG